MNQFKRAKQISNPTESITDLKTAGVVEPKKQLPKQDTELPIKKEEDFSGKLDTETVPDIIQPVITEEKTPLSKTESSAVETENSTNIVLSQVPNAEPMPNSIPIQKTEIIPQPVVYNDPSALQTTNAQPQIISSQPVMQPVVQPQYVESAVTYKPESVETKPAKSNKKSAPNMFTQKNESKSIRKSLVLRPSSVKIAENYCAKNGGSFNELIQILLDNFIEEYGL